MPGAQEGQRFLAPDGEPRAFIIVSSARSGSNLLVGYLRQVREAACFGEILRSDFVDKPGWQKLVDRLDLPAEARALHAADLTAFWELVLAHGLRRRRWIGAKIFYYHRRDDAVWDRFAEPDHRVIHLWRDATFDQYVSRLLAVASGEWKDRGELGDGGGRRGSGAADPGSKGNGAGHSSAESGEDLRVIFDRDDYLRYREALRTDITAVRARYGGTDRYFEIEYRQLLEHTFVAGTLERLFGARVDVAETLRQQRPRPKIEYLANPEDAEPFVNDSIRAGFASA